ncbi:MAG TPA: hypothetical protein VFV33_13695, partial [Gemmatimonadaceae bacterium]|nr:hypothetical protein [Gemmatimonadaceae bacterium]
LTGCPASSHAYGVTWAMASGAVTTGRIWPRPVLRDLSIALNTPIAALSSRPRSVEDRVEIAAAHVALSSRRLRR